MSLNIHTTSGINPVSASRLQGSNLVRADSTPQTLTVTETLAGLATYAALAINSILNLPTAAIFIGSQALNGVQEGDAFPFEVRNRDGAQTLTLTPGTGGTMDPAGGGVVAFTSNRSYLIRVDDVTPGTENYTVFDVTDTGAQI